MCALRDAGWSDIPVIKVVCGKWSILNLVGGEVCLRYPEMSEVT